MGEIEASRQVRRRATRLGRELAAAIEIKRPRQRRARGERDADSRYSHRFEVIGHYAHYGPGTWLYEHSAAKKRGRCPRCGSCCRRVWRGPHVRGPAEQPLVLKTRIITQGPAASRPRSHSEADASRGRLARLLGRIRLAGG